MEEGGQIRMHEMHACADSHNLYSQEEASLNHMSPFSKRNPGDCLKTGLENHFLLRELMFLISSWTCALLISIATFLTPPPPPSFLCTHTLIITCSSVT